MAVAAGILANEGRSAISIEPAIALASVRPSIPDCVHPACCRSAGLAFAPCLRQPVTTEMTLRRPLLDYVYQPAMLFNRLRNSTVIWSWIFNGLRLATGLLLLPLVCAKLSKEELGMYYILYSQVALANVIDFGFSPTILRFVSYAMGGAKTIQAHGVSTGTGSGPSFLLLWQLFYTTRALYRVMALLVFIILGLWGTYLVELRIQETPAPNVTRLAWLITLIATVLSVYSSWAPVFLRGMDDVLTSVRITVLASVVRFIVAVGLLLAGAGLMSLPLGDLLGSLIQQVMARLTCLRRLGQRPQIEKVAVWQNLRTMWPNSWRLGLLSVAGYLTVNGNMAICLSKLGLADNARYGLSVQLMGVISGMACVWTQVKWQVIGQQRARHDHAAIQQTLWPRLWRQYLTFFAMTGVLLLCGPTLPSWGYKLLPKPF